MQSPFNSASPLEDHIASLFAGLGIYLVAILVLVLSLVTYACIHFRARPGDGDAQQRPGSTKLETTWTVLPLISLVILFVFTMRAMWGSDPGDPPDPGGAELVVVALSRKSSKKTCNACVLQRSWASHLLLERQARG
jgi:heme/copper-type cytochrome/quinol oxidase subunit 2